MITKEKLQAILVGTALVIEVLALLVWDFRYEWIETIVGEQGMSISKFQIMMLLVSLGVIYLAFQYQVDRQILWVGKNELQRRMFEIRKEIDKLFDQQKELNQINALLEGRIIERKAELIRNNESIEKYI